MLDITVRVKGIDELQSYLAGVQNQIPFATSVAMNETAKDIKQAEEKEMNRVFDRPTPFTIKSLRIEYAKKKRLKSRVWFKDVGFTATVITDYMTTQIEGGKRKAKASERAMRRRGILNENEYIVPSRTAPLDKYGNIRGGTMQKILANIGGFDDPNLNTPVQWTRGRGRKSEYIFGSVNGTKGIYRIDGDRWRLVFIVVRGAPTYRKRFDFYGVGNKTFDKKYDVNFDKALDRAIKTAK